MRRGSGTCRDFAWLMIDGVRSLASPPGLLVATSLVPNTASTEMVGGGSTHAWLQVYLPGAGWVDFDPYPYTFIGNRNPDPRRSCMAPEGSLGPPLWGTFTGALGSALKMQVDVTVTEEFGSARTNRRARYDMRLRVVTNYLPTVLNRRR